MQIANCKLQIEKCLSAPRVGDCAHSPLCRGGMTLVELLVTITIISILAGLILGVASVAGETAREAQTRHVVARLHTLLMAHYDTYKTRRIKLTADVEDKINTKFKNDPAKRGMATAEARLFALRELMLMEIPDRWSDVLLQRVEDTSTPPSPVYFFGRTDLANIYLRRYNALVGRVNAITGVANSPEEIKANQSAECLYMVITLACGDGEARSLFGERSIGDTDGDGAPEFLDGWDHPIGFLRWAPGFDSQIQIDANQFTGPSDSAWKTAAAGDHDPFDLFRVDPFAYRLVPLIYAAGRDEDYGVYDGADYEPTYEAIWRPSGSVTFSFNNSAPYISSPRLNPYATIGSGSAAAYLGTDTGAGAAADNVHNHLLGQR